MSIFGGLSSTSSQSNLVEGSTSADNAAKLEEDLNQFLTLLVTQLQNQDPLDPMDSNEFTAQLVQFAGVEQQIYQNSNLEQLLALQETNQVSSMVNFIDRVIEVDGTTFPLENGQAEFTYTMPAGAKSASILIRDSNGVTVFETDANTSSGKQTFEWDGTDSQGQAVADGQYTVLVTGLDQRNEILDISQTVYGRVTGVGVDNGQTTLFMGDIQVPQAKVLTVKEAPAADAAL